MKRSGPGHTELTLYGSRRIVDWLGVEGHLAKRNCLQRLMGTIGEVDLKACDIVDHPRQSLDTYHRFYSESRRHQSLDRQTPDSVNYYAAASRAA